MSAKFRNFRVQPNLREQGRNFSSQAVARRILLLSRVTQNIVHLFLHAPAMPGGHASQLI
jgi:hypothetical protein